MTTTPTIESQKLVTPQIAQLMEFDFRSIGGSARVFLANQQEGDGSGGYQKIDIEWPTSSSPVRVFEHIDFTISSLRCDLTGSIAEPTLSIAAYDLWQISGWASATSSLSLMDYRGLKMQRQRLFYSTPTMIAPQTFFVKNVDELTPEVITFTLTPSMGTENGNKPSARKLEI